MVYCWLLLLRFEVSIRRKLCGKTLFGKESELICFVRQRAVAFKEFRAIKENLSTLHKITGVPQEYFRYWSDPTHYRP